MSNYLSCRCLSGPLQDVAAGLAFKDSPSLGELAVGRSYRTLLLDRRMDSRTLPLRRLFLRIRTVTFCFSLSEVSKLRKNLEK